PDQYGFYTGCRKYAECDLIPDSVRWRAWDELTDEEKDTLRNTNCYRATRVVWDPVNKTGIESKRSSWDPQALPSRRSNLLDAHWVGNPFGVRTPILGKIAQDARETGVDLSAHRDLSPCPVGGCVTPEMQRDYLWEKQ